MKVTVRYFASIREAIGTGHEAVDTAAATLGALRDELIARGGAHASSLARGGRCAWRSTRRSATKPPPWPTGPRWRSFRPSRAVERLQPGLHRG